MDTGLYLWSVLMIYLVLSTTVLFYLPLNPNYLAHVPTCEKLDRIIAQQAGEIILLPFFRFEIGTFPQLLSNKIIVCVFVHDCVYVYTCRSQRLMLTCVYM